LRRLAQRRARGAYSLTRYKVGTVLLSPQGQRIQLSRLLPRRVGQLKEVRVLVGVRAQLPMRLLLLRVPKEVGEERREQLRVDAQRRGQALSEEALELAEWTILLTDVPAKRLRFEEALVLLRERWQMELLYKLWKQEGQVDEWRTANRWRVLCELYAKLIGVLLQHWLMVLFAWQEPQRSLVKLAQVVRETSWTLISALAGHCSLRIALQRIGRRMQSGSRMNTRRKRPNSAQLLERQGVEWALSWCE
ncbi:MAG: transposase, partial [Ktedonobacteraceae bacterium]